MNQLLESSFPLNPAESVQILRNQKGLDEAELGMGNPKAINQLLAHHGVVFQPEKRLLWVSANPFQLGQFLCYDLNKIFNESETIEVGHKLVVDSLSFQEDDFLHSQDYQQFLRYKELKNRLFAFIALGRVIDWNEELETEFINSNPESYITYFMLGDYYLEQGEKIKAKSFYEMSLSKEVASEQERNKIKQNLKQCH
jgi:hypothetical protein